MYFLTTKNSILVTMATRDVKFVLCLFFVILNNIAKYEVWIFHRSWDSKFALRQSECVAIDHRRCVLVCLCVSMFHLYRFWKFKFDDVIPAILAGSVQALSRSQFCSNFIQSLWRESRTSSRVCYLKSAKSVDNFESYG